MPGPNHNLSALSTPLDYFSILFPLHLLPQFAQETNSYVKIYEAKRRKQRGSEGWSDKLWTDVCEEDLRAFFGIRMIMGIDPKHSFTDYWSTSTALQNKFIATSITRDRYERIQRYIHLTPGGQVNTTEDPLFKINPLLDYVRNKSSEAYNLHPNLSVDEAMVKFHGRHWGVVGAPNKPAKRGFKIFVLADGETGYLHNWKVYLRKKREVGLTQTVVE